MVQIFLGIFRKISRKFPEHFPEISWIFRIFRESSGQIYKFLDISWSFPGNFPENFPENFLKISRNLKKFPRNIPGISKISQNISRIFPEMFQRNRGTYSLAVFHTAHFYELVFSFLFMGVRRVSRRLPGASRGSRHIRFAGFLHFC